jgi:hypothetical protein
VRFHLRRTIRNGAADVCCAYRRGALAAAVTFGLAFALSSSSATAAESVSRGSFDKQLARNATNDFIGPKLACVCQEPGPFDGVAGHLFRLAQPVEFIGGTFTSLRVVCRVLGFDAATGAEADFDVCTHYLVLPR